MSWFGKSAAEREAERRGKIEAAFPVNGQDSDYWYGVYMLVNVATSPYEGDRILLSALATHEATIKSLLERIERLEG